MDGGSEDASQLNPDLICPPSCQLPTAIELDQPVGHFGTSKADSSSSEGGTYVLKQVLKPPQSPLNPQSPDGLDDVWNSIQSAVRDGSQSVGNEDACELALAAASCRELRGFAEVRFSEQPME